MTVDIWPELDWSKAIRTPRTVLLEQREIISKKSKELLSLYVGGVKQMKTDRFPEGAFTYEAAVYASRLSYHVGLLTVVHSLLSPYPAIVVDARDKTAQEVSDETEFLDALRRLLSTPHWIETMDRLISMSNSG